jgi:hypothetical protein
VTPNPDPNHVVPSIEVDIEAEVHVLDEEDEVQDIVDEQPSSPRPPSVADSPMPNSSVEGGESNEEIPMEAGESEEEEGEDVVAQEEEEEEEEAEGVENEQGMEQAGGIEDGRSPPHIDEDETESAQTEDGPELMYEAEPDPGAHAAESSQESEPDIELKLEVEEGTMKPEREAEADGRPERAVDEDPVSSGDEPLQVTRRKQFFL